MLTNEGDAVCRCGVNVFVISVLFNSVINSLSFFYSTGGGYCELVPKYFVALFLAVAERVKKDVSVPSSFHSRY